MNLLRPTIPLFSAVLVAATIASAEDRPAAMQPRAATGATAVRREARLPTPMILRERPRFVAVIPSTESIAVQGKAAVESEKMKAIMAASASRTLGPPKVTDVGEGPEHVIGKNDSLVIKGSDLGGFFGAKTVIPTVTAAFGKCGGFELPVTKVSAMGDWVAVDVPNKDFVVNDRFVRGKLMMQTPAGSTVADITYIAKLAHVNVRTGVMAMVPYFNPKENPWNLSLGKNAVFAPSAPLSRWTSTWQTDRVGLGIKLINGWHLTEQGVDDYNGGHGNALVNTEAVRLDSEGHEAGFQYHEIDHHGVSGYVGNPNYSTKLEMMITWESHAKEKDDDYLFWWGLEGPAGTRPADILPSTGACNGSS